LRHQLKVPHFSFFEVAPAFFPWLVGDRARRIFLIGNTPPSSTALSKVFLE